MPVETVPAVVPSVVFTFDPDTLYWEPKRVAVVLALSTVNWTLELILCTSPPAFAAGAAIKIMINGRSLFIPSHGLGVYLFREMLYYGQMKCSLLYSPHMGIPIWGLTGGETRSNINTSTTQESLHFLIRWTTPLKPRPIGCINHVSHILP